MSDDYLDAKDTDFTVLEKDVVRKNNKIVGIKFDNNEIYEINTILGVVDVSTLIDLIFYYGKNYFYYMGIGENDGLVCNVIKYNDKEDEINKENIIKYDVSFNSEYVNDKYGHKYYYEKIKDSIEDRIIKKGDIEDFQSSVSEDEVELSFKLKLEKEINSYAAFLIIEQICSEIGLNIINKMNYKTLPEKLLINERQFCMNVLMPLFRLMNFMNIRFYHNPNEFGKDIIFSDTDKFGIKHSFGVQVKIGNISGKAGSNLDKLIAQIDDAFALPYLEISNKQEEYITDLLIITSGKFTHNAQEKILKKIKNKNIYFLDIDKIQELVAKYTNSQILIE